MAGDTPVFLASASIVVPRRRRIASEMLQQSYAAVSLGVKETITRGTTVTDTKRGASGLPSPPFLLTVTVARSSGIKWNPMSAVAMVVPARMLMTVFAQEHVVNGLRV